ncbi:MAG: HD domain-containing phosphohydrolase [Chloroflexota bacterium]
MTEPQQNRTDPPPGQGGPALRLFDDLGEFQVLFDFSPDALFILDTDGTILAANDIAIDRYGYGREELPHLAAADLAAPDSRDRADEKIEAAARSGAPFEAKHQEKDGKVFDVEGRARAIRLHGRDCVLLHTRDISSRKHLEGTMLEGFNRYRQTVENMLEGFQIIDFDWRYIYVNDAAARQARKAPTEILMRTIMDIFPGIETTEVFKVLRHCMDERISRRTVGEFNFPDGQSRWFELSVQPVAEGIFILSSDITEQKRAEQQIQEQLERLNTLHAIDNLISSSFDLHLILDSFLGYLVAQIKVDAAAVLLLHPHTMTLECAASRGFLSSAIRRAKFGLRDGLSGQAILNRQRVYIPNLAEAGEGLSGAARLAGEHFVSYIAVPLIVKGQAVGVLEVCHRSQLDHYPEWLDFLGTLAGQAAIAIDNANLFESLQRSNFELILAYDATIEGWSHAMDLRDREAEGHTRRVTEMALRLASAMGVPEADLIHIRRGALLHDIGKLGVPDQVLFKDDALTEEEWEMLRLHPVYAYEMLTPISYLAPAIDIPYCHHEKWDGSGYPRGLKGEQIPLSARIFAVVDVWDSLQSPPLPPGLERRQGARVHPRADRQTLRPGGGGEIHGVVWG